MPVATLTVALSTAWCLLPMPSFAQDKDKAANVDDQARKLIFLGLDAFRLGNWLDAELAYQGAWKLKRGFDVATSLGEVEFRLGKYHEAAEHLAYAVKHLPVTADPKKKAGLQKLLDEARSKVGEVAVTVNTEKAEVFVDKVLVGVAPLELPLFVTPGNHTIEAKREGYTTATQSITAAAGSSQNAALVLELIPSAKADGNGAGGNGVGGAGGATGGVVNANGSGTPGGNSGSAPDPAWMAVTGGLAAIGIGLGIGFTVAANGKGDDATALQPPGNASVCFGPSPAPGCADFHDALDAQSTLSNAALVSFLVGGAFGLGTAGLALWTWTGSTDSQKSGVRAVPALSATHSGVTIFGAW